MEDHLPPSDQPRIAIFGSVDFHDSQSSPLLCSDIGTALGKEFPQLCILTGANAVVQEHISRAFQKEAKTAARIFHLSPEKHKCDWDFGRCLEAGRDASERRYILATLADICISVEGGPGTADELKIARENGKIVIPLGRSGGASCGMFDAPAISRPSFVEEETWSLLQNKDASVKDSARAVTSIVRGAIEDKKKRAQLSSNEQRKASHLEAMERIIVDALDTTYSKRPKLPLDYPCYVEPTMAGCAHRVFHGKEHMAAKSNNSLGDIYLGPQGAVEPSFLEELEVKGIRAIVNCTKSCPCHFRDNGIKYCNVAVNDECGANILLFLDGAAVFLDKYIREGNNVLVHCQMGISRSSTLVIAYLMKFWGMTRDGAYLHVKARRPKTNPNPGFWDQLGEYEHRCCKKTMPQDGVSQEVQFDEQWAQQSAALFSTCRENEDLLATNSLTRCLWEVKEERAKLIRVLTLCLDYLWSRGIIEGDLDWLVFVCQTVDSDQAKEIEGGSRISVATVQEILEDQDSDFWGLWAGEVYENQIQKVLNKLKS